MRESVETHLGQYQIRGRIGSGGMGDVFDALHVGLNKRVAIKTLRKQLLEDDTVVARFLREGQLASRLRHPNVVDVTDVGMIDGVPCLVMELLEGEALSALMKREKNLPLATVVDLMLPVIAALDHAHAAGILHRDLKPSNIFLARQWNGEPVAKVLDFGISKLLSDPAQQQLTTDSAFVGTPQYASPEATRAEKTLDARSDQYSIGVILYEASTGARPFAHRAGSFLTLAMAICQGDFAPPRTHRPELPEAFERAVMRAMATSPDRRFAQTRDLGTALLPFASERGRLIWEPTFGGAPQPLGRTEDLHTAVLAAPATSVPGAGLASGVVSGGAAAVMSGLASASGPGSLGQPPSFAGFPSAAGPLASFGAASSHTPPPAHLDRSHGSYGSQFGSQVTPRRGSFAFAAAAGVLVAVVVAGTFLVSRSIASGRGGADDDVAAAYVVDVTVDPPTASLELDGVPVARGRLEQRILDGRPHTLTASAPGYEPVTVTFQAGAPPPTRLALRAVAAPAPTGGATAAGSAKPHPTTGPTPHGASAPRTPKEPKEPAGKPGEPRPRTDNINPWE